MASLIVSGICRLTRDAEVYNSTNASWVHFGLAAFRKNPKEGQQDVDFFDAEYYMRNPKSGIEKVLTKGRLIYLDRAELRNDTFTGRDGKKKYKQKILIYSFEALSSKKENAAETKQETQKPQQERKRSSKAPLPKHKDPDQEAMTQMYGVKKKDAPIDVPEDEEIPF